LSFLFLFGNQEVVVEFFVLAVLENVIGSLDGSIGSYYFLVTVGADLLDVVIV